jgi:hypothetical protein
MNAFLAFCLANRAELLWSLAIIFVGAFSLLWAERIAMKPPE